jgi:hypothetical protein
MADSSKKKKPKCYWQGCGSFGLFKFVNLQLQRKCYDSEIFAWGCEFMLQSRKDLKIRKSLLLPSVLNPYNHTNHN